jgi:hypothetical protein
MNNELIFFERQRFKQWWIWLILVGIDAVFLLGIFQQIIRGRPFGDNPMSNLGLIISTLLILLFNLLVLNIRLETLIKRDGIYVRFFPIQLRFKFFSWAALEKCYVRTYSALSEFGGWGLRFGAYNVSGEKGLQLEFTNKSKFLIGTNKPEQIIEALKILGQLKQ